MPTYPYRCKDCDHEFEEFQPITDDPLSKCPECGGRVHRLITGGGGILFKGSGFYLTDYRSKNYMTAASKDKPDAAGGATSKADTKPGSSTSNSKSSTKKSE